MVQVKKAQVRSAILKSARTLFKKKGFLNCTVNQIAKEAGTAVSNVYVYFPSKVHLFFEVYSPILEKQLQALVDEVEEVSEPRDKLRLILMTLWRGIVRKNNYFAHNLLEAVISTVEKEKKPHGLFDHSVSVIHQLLVDSLPPHRQHLVQDSSLAFLLLMAFDGFVVNARIEEIDDLEVLVERVCDLLLGT